MRISEDRALLPAWFRFALEMSRTRASAFLAASLDHFIFTVAFATSETWTVTGSNTHVAKFDEVFLTLAARAAFNSFTGMLV